MHYHRVVVKIGSSVLLQKKRALSPRIFAHFAKQVVTLRENGVDVILVSSGAIAAGMTRLNIRKRPTAVAEQQALAACGQTQLMHFYERAFGRYRQKVGQLLLTRGDFISKVRYRNARHTIATLLRWHIVPIINENDSVAVEEIRFGDNDQLAALTTKLVHAHLLIILSDIDSVYTKDPKHHRNAKPIPVIHNIDEWIHTAGGDTRRETSTGGMKTKFLAAAFAAHHGIPTMIADGSVPNILTKLVLGKKAIGTIVLPHRRGRKG